MTRCLIFAAFAVATMTHSLPATDKRPMQIDDLYKFKRVAEPQISPDGRTLLVSANLGGQTNLYTYSLDETARAERANLLLLKCLQVFKDALNV